MFIWFSQKKFTPTELFAKRKASVADLLCFPPNIWLRNIWSMCSSFWEKMFSKVTTQIKSHKATHREWAKYQFCKFCCFWSINLFTMMGDYSHLQFMIWANKKYNLFALHMKKREHTALCPYDSCCGCSIPSIQQLYTF